MLSRCVRLTSVNNKIQKKSISRSTRRRRNFSSSNTLFGKVLVLAEHDNAKLNPATLSAVTAGKALGDVDVLVLGAGCGDVASQAGKVNNVKRVFVSDNDVYRNPIAEDVCSAVLARHSKDNYTHILAPATSNGKNALPRVGANLDMQPISDIVKIVDADTFVRPIYAGNALATVKSKDPVKIITVRTTAFPKEEETGGSAEIVQEEGPGSAGLSTFVEKKVATSERPELASASKVVSGGRALESGDNFKILYELADKLGAAVGASRAAVDAGYVPNDMQIGQTGKIVAPELYIACGISGAIQHVAGMKDSKVIVAINTDPDAPIFQIADYGLVQDLFTAVPEITSKLD